MVDILKQQHVGRITITGGEPMLLGAELFDFLRYVHDKQIHTCLSTTGFRITKAQFEEMDQYLDQMMISIRSLDMKFWKRDFGKTHFAEELLPQVLTLLEWARSTRINFEVCTVVHKENIDSIVDLGWNLLRLNPQIFWRIDEYYGMELNSDMRHRFQLEDSAFDQIHEQIGHLFEGRFKGIRFTTKQQRENSLEYLITYSGELVTSFEHNHNNIGLNLLKSQLPFEFKMLRTWS
jgi:pyruvate-formate lyase-activating enzyme